ncbi:MAG TPA: exopolysaccharide biosynthesis polyprenyl glycosylphosphotransferase [Candidatus Limnocylindria bacterium]|nr:exopolysaccharide biosynthesis polyprenyl glycosylphosphotransferase [Candidatus Limnocylindria bacterium]
MAGDFTMIGLGLMLGFWLRFKSGIFSGRSTWWSTNEGKPPSFDDYAPLILVGALFLFATFLYLNLYQHQTLLRFRRVALKIVKGTVFWLFAYLSLSLVLKFTPPISRIYVLLSFQMVLVCLLIWRALFHRLLQTENIAQALRQNVLFIGWNKDATRIAEGIFSDSYQPYRLIGCLPSPSGRFQDAPPPGTATLGDYNTLADVIRQHGIDIVVLADLETSTGEIVGLTNLCELNLVQFKVIPSYFQILVSGLTLDSISGVPIMGVSELPLDRLWNRMLKRGVDILGAVVGLILSTPIIAIFGTLIYLESPGPIFYRQIRTGRNGKDFAIIKLRSMKLDAEKDGAQWAKKHDDRRLRIGAMLREWNLDEVPQFWNVLKGDMSLVGPRPERPELIANFQYEIPHYNARLATKPGITGWAQVNGLRGDTDLAERVRYDLYYLENWGLWLDFQIMVQTFLKRDNAY